MSGILFNQIQTIMIYNDGGVLNPGEITGDRAGDREFCCSVLDGVLALDDATASTRRPCRSCNASECYERNRERF